MHKQAMFNPNQIVLLVTKAVGDFFGGVGIADELIRFNGYPLLEKKEHSFNISGKYWKLVAELGNKTDLSSL